MCFLFPSQPSTSSLHCAYKPAFVFLHFHSYLSLPLQSPSLLSILLGYFVSSERNPFAQKEEATSLVCLLLQLPTLFCSFQECFFVVSISKMCLSFYLNFFFQLLLIETCVFIVILDRIRISLSYIAFALCGLLDWNKQIESDILDLILDLWNPSFILRTWCSLIH